MNTKPLDIGQSPTGSRFALPLDTVTATIAILAIKGKGKTYLSDVLSEELLKHGQIPVIIDYTGAHWGLKSSADGSRAGFPVVVFGGEHADLPLEPGAGEVIAGAIVEQRFPAIVDVSTLRKGEANRFLGDFLEALYRLNRLPLMLVCDEADAYAPQKPFGDQARTLGAIEDIVRRGRIRGIGCTLITQRPQVINKNVLTQSEMLVALGMSHPKDIGAIKEWVDVNGDRTQADAMIASLPSLAKGTAWFWAPAMGLFERVQVRPRETFDSSATPKPGEVRRVPQALAAIDISKLGQQIAATAQRAKDSSPAELRKRIARLEAELAAKPARASVEKVETPVLPAGAEGVLARLAETVDSLAMQTGQVKADLDTILREIRGSLARFTPAGGPAGVPQPVRAQENAGRVVPASPVTRPARAGSDSAEALGKAERRVLAVLAQHPEGCAKGKLALLSGYTYSGGFRNTLSALRSRGLIEGGNEEVMRITDAGLTALGEYDPLPAGEELRQFWLSSPLFGQAERDILSHLFSADDQVDGPALAAAVRREYSGGFRNSLSTLRTAGVIVGRNTGVIALAPDLQ
jgi:uncharacterized protein